MMSQPEHMDADFFTQTLLATFTPATDASAGEWQTLGKELLHFYADQLPHHPEWVQPIDRALVSDTRTLLIRQMGQRNEETALYQHILQQAQYNYADMTLNDMVADTDVTALFTTEQTVPGIFTRKAWEGSIEPAIKKAVNTRRNEIDWVLSDSQQTLDSDIDPEKLKERLTARYFADFSGSWLSFLNSLQWRNTNTLADTID
ncbi:type VI secretion protein VasK, partial [Pseudomonas aeruginosa]